MHALVFCLVVSETFPIKSTHCLCQMHPARTTGQGRLAFLSCVKVLDLSAADVCVAWCLP